MSICSTSLTPEGSREDRMISDIRCENCPICLDKMKKKLTVTTVCLHTFCYDCLSQHINNSVARQSDPVCPYCRSELFERSDAVDEDGGIIVTGGAALWEADMVEHWGTEGVVDRVELGGVLEVEDDLVDHLDGSIRVLESEFWAEVDGETDELSELMAARPSINEMNEISLNNVIYNVDNVFNRNSNVLINQNLHEDMELSEILENLDNDTDVVDMNPTQDINIISNNGGNSEGLGDTTELFIAALSKYKGDVYRYMNNNTILNNDINYMLQELLKYINTLDTIVRNCRSLR
jgi:hypothetical protein